MNLTILNLNGPDIEVRGEFWDLVQLIGELTAPKEEHQCDSCQCCDNEVSDESHPDEEIYPPVEDEQCCGHWCMCACPKCKEA